MSRRWVRTGILISLSLAFGAGVAHADDGSISPYIDSIKAKMKEKKEPQPTEEVPDPYIQEQKKKLEKEGKGGQTQTGVEPYIDELRARNPKLGEPLEKTPGEYTEEQKAKLGPEKGEGAIEAYKEGKSQLRLLRPGSVTASFALKVGAAVSHSYSGSSAYVANSFDTIYGSGWAPDLRFEGEYFLLNHQTLGGFGIVGMAGVSWYHGTGRFAIQLTEPDGHTPFSKSSQTKMTFISVPVTIAVKYQINALHFVRPYALIGPTLIGMSETRNDGIGAKYALSKGLTTTAGIAFLLDWIGGRQHAWNLYQDYEIKHYYLNVEYSKLTTFASNIDVSFSGLNVGFTFEF